MITLEAAEAVVRDWIRPRKQAILLIMASLETSITRRERETNKRKMKKKEKCERGVRACGRE